MMVVWLEILLDWRQLVVIQWVGLVPVIIIIVFESRVEEHCLDGWKYLARVQQHDTWLFDLLHRMVINIFIFLYFVVIIIFLFLTVAQIQSNV